MTADKFYNAETPLVIVLALDPTIHQTSFRICELEDSDEMVKSMELMYPRAIIMTKLNIKARELNIKCN